MIKKSIVLYAALTSLPSTGLATVDNYQIQMLIFSRPMIQSIKYVNSLSQQRSLPENLPTENPLAFNPSFNQIEHNLQNKLHYTILWKNSWLINRNDIARKTITIPIQSEDNTTELLKGTVTLNLNRYFNATFNLQLAKIANHHFSTEQPCTHAICYFNLKQTRRSKSKVLNYIDHPILGIIYKITPKILNH